jgi:hypothetical protein
MPFNSLARSNSKLLCRATTYHSAFYLPMNVCWRLPAKNTFKLGTQNVGALGRVETRRNENFAGSFVARLRNPLVPGAGLEPAQTFRSEGF